MARGRFLMVRSRAKRGVSSLETALRASSGCGAHSRLLPHGEEPRGARRLVPRDGATRLLGMRGALEAIPHGEEPREARRLEPSFETRSGQACVTASEWRARAPRRGATSIHTETVAADASELELKRCRYPSRSPFAASTSFVGGEMVSGWRNSRTRRIFAPWRFTSPHARSTSSTTTAALSLDFWRFLD
jgi:hypothetical protein